jgi:hypothetical protein
MAVLQTSDLKQRAGEILDAARREPQFIFREGQLFMLTPVEPGPGVRVMPEGYFADAYQDWPVERSKTEKEWSGVKQEIPFPSPSPFIG